MKKNEHSASSIAKAYAQYGGDDPFLRQQCAVILASPDRDRLLAMCAKLANSVPKMGALIALEVLSKVGMRASVGDSDEWVRLMEAIETA